MIISLWLEQTCLNNHGLKASLGDQNGSSTTSLYSWMQYIYYIAVNISRQYLSHSNILEKSHYPLLFFKTYYCSLQQRWNLRVITWVIKYHAALLFPKYWLDIMVEGAPAFSSLLIYLKPIFSVTRLHFSHPTASELPGREQNDLPLFFKSIRTWHMECP